MCGIHRITPFTSIIPAAETLGQTPHHKNPGALFIARPLIVFS